MDRRRFLRSVAAQPERLSPPRAALHSPRPTARRPPSASPSSAGRSTISSAPTGSTGTSRDRSISPPRAASKPAPTSLPSAPACRKWPISVRPSRAPPSGERPRRATPRPTAISVTARDNWYMAAIHYGAAEWPYDDSGKQHLALHAKKRDCYANYARLADHKIEAVSIPFKGGSIPGWFHLPPGYNGGRLPVIIVIPGMDSFKETSVALANDRWMMRGAAVLAIDGPGQYESPLLGVYVSMQNWIDAGPAVVDWLMRRPEIDAAEGRRHRYELRLVFRNHPGGERAARCRHRGHFHLSRARLSYDLRGGFTRPSRSASCGCRTTPTNRSSMNSSRR